MQFMLASTNEHKAWEFKDLLAGAPFEIITAPMQVKVDEDGHTFEQNAYKKAMAYYKAFKAPTLADDSGLVIPSMPEILGVQSARFAPELLTYPEKNAKLLSMLEGRQDRQAYFVCVLCFVLSEEEVYFFEGRVHGRIGTEIKGDQGFGYDPIFEPEGLEGSTLAQAGEWKMQNSHRAKACKEAIIFFQGKNSVAKAE